MRHILIVQLARFGDLVQTKRMVLSAAAEPDAVVHLAVDGSLVEVAAMLYPDAVVHGLPAHAGPDADAAAVLLRAVAVAEELRSIPFSAVYLLNASPLSYALATLFDPYAVRGYAVDTGQPVRSRWCRMLARITGHRLSSPLNLVDFWGHFHPRPVAPEQVNPIARPARSNRIGIVMSGRQARRSLPPEELAACVQAVFQARGGPALVCIGGAQERPLARRFSRQLSSQALQKLEDTTGRTALTDLPDLLRGLDLVLTPDTGVMHLAAHLGVPVQAFFLSSAWCFETGPYGVGHIVWQALGPCAPCLESAMCPRQNACLAAFRQDGFLDHLAGRPAAAWPADLLSCISGLDRLGATYVLADGTDPQAERRRGLRRALMEYLGLARGGVPGVAGELLFEETDWMLPELGCFRPRGIPAFDRAPVWSLGTEGTKES